MADATRPQLETLEGKLLMSGDALKAAATLHAEVIYSQTEVHHLHAESTPTHPKTPAKTPTSHPSTPKKPVTPSVKKNVDPAIVMNGLSITLSTDKSTYSVGDTVTMTYTETNVSNAPILVVTGPSADGFDVTQNGNAIWSSNSGPLPMFLVRQTLQPGKSLTFTATWTAATKGTFTIDQQSAPEGGPTATITVS